MKQLLCIKWGVLYPADYVNKLYAMIARRITGPFRLVCLTDDSNGIRAEVECLPCPTVALPAPYNNMTWRKMSLWAAELPNMTGDWLFLDLDVIITGDLDVFFDYEPDKTFIVMRNWTQPRKEIGNTSVYRFRVGAHAYLLEDIERDYQAVFDRFRNSQTYISRSVREISFWPDEWCVLFKTHCVPPMPSRWWKTPVIPENARIIAFPGVPNPHEAAAGEWPAKWYKRFYKHIRPARWVDDYWHE